MSSPSSFGVQLKQYRLASGRLTEEARSRRLTQEELAKRAGYSPTYIKKIEAGALIPPPPTIDRLADILDLTPDERVALHATADAARTGAPTNLPSPGTRLIGRREEAEAVITHLRRSGVGLLTLVGPPGVGKSRLALEAARQLRPAFPDGVFWVSLAAIDDAALVLARIAGTLGASDAGTASLADAVAAAIGDRRLLLVLDTFEHVLAAAPQLSDLLAACRHLKLLVTSRTVLGLAVEHTYPVAPLAVPDVTAGHLDVDAVGRCDAALLFLERAQAVKPELSLTRENAPAVAQLCRQLDGLPLALVLGAALLRALPLQAMLPRLEHRLQLLTSGPVDFPARHRALRVAIDWSYEHLTASQQAVFRRLAVFRGGCTLDAAEAVCGAPEEAPGWSVLEAMVRLVDHSLVQLDQERERYTMLDTIQEYAAERLAVSGEEDEIRRRHAGYLVQLAETAKPQLTGREQARWLEQLEREHDNLRAALRWARDRGCTDLLVRLAGALGRFWVAHGHLNEGARWLEAALAQGGETTRARFDVLDGAAHIAFRQLDFERSQALVEEELALARTLEDAMLISRATGHLGMVVAAQGDYERATALMEEELRGYREQGATGGISVSLGNLAFVARLQGDLDRALALAAECVAHAQQAGWQENVCIGLNLLAVVAHEQGQWERARAMHRDCLRHAWAIGFKPTIAYGLEGLAVVAAKEGNMERAARLLGAVTALRASSGLPRPPYEHSLPEDVEREARHNAAAWEEGQALSLEQAIAYALDEDAP